jgi:hypothetical protein
MDESLNYKKYMEIWRNSKEQREIMIKEKCIKHFTIIKPKI